MSSTSSADAFNDVVIACVVSIGFWAASHIDKDALFTGTLPYDIGQGEVEQYLVFPR